MNTLYLSNSNYSGCLCRNRTVNLLHRHLFEDYSSDVRPVYNASIPTKVTHRALFRNLLNLVGWYDNSLKKYHFSNHSTIILKIESTIIIQFEWLKVECYVLIKLNNKKWARNEEFMEVWAFSSIYCFHAAGGCRRQVKNVKNCVKKVKILEFHDHIWNHREKYIQKRTNMPGIGSLIREI